MSLCVKARTLGYVAKYLCGGTMSEVSLKIGGIDMDVGIARAEEGPRYDDGVDFHAPYDASRSCTALCMALRLQTPFRSCRL